MILQLHRGAARSQSRAPRTLSKIDWARRVIQRWTILFVCCGLYALAMVPTAVAQTADGATPANEGICDGLKGLTPALYGLCVAFCEAQDLADVSAGMTDVELQALIAGTPSGKILQQYNARKADTDPPMPCIKVEEPCPCWTAEELSVALPPTQEPDQNFVHACENDHRLALLENRDNYPSSWWQAHTWYLTSPNYCNINGLTYDGLGFVRYVPELTPEQLTACNAQLAAHANTYKVEGEVWDCFTE